MALDTIVIKITDDSKDIDKTINQLKKLKKIDAENAKSFEKTNKKFQKEQDKNKQAVGSFKQSLLGLGPVLLGAFSIAAITAFTKQVISTRAEFQKLAAVLVNTLGSKSAAQKALDDIKRFAAETPFAVLELTDSFVKLVNQGFKPTREEMRKLGDIAASTGKSFDQLAEAIIDAQVGEFERLKEFGIRAQKEGDRVTFTFKGVEEQVDFTQDSIQAYVLSLGDAVGVSGAMAAISATLGGRISNMDDAYDSFLDALGERGQSIFASAIGSITDMVQELEEFVLIPVSEKLDDERIALNLLVLKITDTNIEQDERNRLIAELQLEYPDFLKNLKEEEITNKLLAGRLKEVNEQLINRIIVQKQQEGIDEINQDLADNRIEQFEKEAELLETLIEASGDFGFELLSQGTISERTAAAQKELAKQFNTWGLLLDPAKRASKSLSNQLGFLNRANKEGIFLDKELIALLDTKNDLMERLGIVTEDIVVVEKEDVVRKKKQVSAIDLLSKKIGELKKELINQALAGDIDQKTVDELTKSLRKLSDAQVDVELATRDAVTMIKAERLELEKIKDLPLIAFDAAAENAKILAEKTEERLSAINKVSQAERQAFGILAQINTNKLIAIDNEEIKQLRALEAQGLGEEELAKRKLAIQQKSDEERAKILTKQAKADKLAAIFEATIATAVAVTKSLDNPILAAIVAVLGAAEIAAIAAQPIPTFHEGKKPELKEGEMFARILKTESVIPPEQSKKYSGIINAMIDKNLEPYVFQEYMIPLMKSMNKGHSSTPYDDIHLWNNQKKQMKLMKETNNILRGFKQKPYNPWGSWG